MPTTQRRNGSIQNNGEIPDADREPMSTSNYADDMRVLSALSLLLGLSFLSIFNSFTNHSFSPGKSTESCTDNYIPSKQLKIAYVVLGTVGFMVLFSAALISYEFCLLFRRDRIQGVERQGRFWLNACYFYVFVGIVISFASHAVGVYMVHCDRDNVFLSYITSLVSIFVLTVLCIAFIEWIHKL